MKRIAFITGATAGIGEAAAHRFAAEGRDLVLTGRRAEKLAEVAGSIRTQYQVSVHTLAFDVCNPVECTQAWNSLPKEWQEIDLLLNNAGLAVGREPIHEGLLEDWERMIDTNLKGLLYMTRLISPGMVARRAGHIINLGSIAGREVYPGGNVYCASKFAVEGLSRAMRIDLAAYNVRVTTISPGMVDTEFSIVRFKGDAEKASKVYEGVTPLVAEDIAAAILWASQQPAHVCINDINLTCTAQPSANIVHRKS
jgi:3-hydroxy acid dehydrogenase/malonic semialdehyde reductase